MKKSEQQKLTSEKYWDTAWEKHALPMLFKGKKNHHYIDILDTFFHKYLPSNKNLEFIELGCSPGRFLHYFSSEFGYKVSGLDNSIVGMDLTKKNLDLLNVDADFYSEDVFEFNPGKKFDVIFSAGLIEHFDPPDRIIKKHFDLVKNNGYVVIGVPNLKKSIYYFLQKLINEDCLRKHLFLDKNDLLRYCEKYNNIVACQYVGVFNLGVLNPSVVLNSTRRFILNKIIDICTAIIDRFLKFFRVKVEIPFFSPYIYIIFKKT